VVALAASASAFDFDDEAAPQAGAAAARPRDTSSKSVPLMHRIGDDGSFVERSQLFYRDAATGGGLRVRMAQGRLAGAELAAFEQLLASGGHYTLKLPSNFSDPASPAVYASVSACALMESRFEEQLELTLSTAGTLTALTYTTPKVPAECPGATAPKVGVDEFVFNPSITIAYPPEGPKVIGRLHDAAFLPGQAAQAMQEAARASAAAGGGKGGEGGEGGQEPPKSFFAKYWMYILPVMLALTMGGGGEEAKDGEAKEGGEGAGAAKAGAGGAGGGKAKKSK